jgi:hypothetical protein
MSFHHEEFFFCLLSAALCASNFFSHQITSLFFLFAGGATFFTLRIVFIFRDRRTIKEKGVSYFPFAAFRALFSHPIFFLREVPG